MKKAFKGSAVDTGTVRDILISLKISFDDAAAATFRSEGCRFRI
jgi:hypothetical protein